MKNNQLYHDAMTKNFFIGEGFLPQFAHIIYDQLLNRKWVSNSSVMQQYYEGVGRKMPSSVSKCDGYGELKKAFSCVVAALREIESDCMESRGGTRNREWRYMGTDANPLANMQNAAIIRDLKTYAQFCQDSAGLMPIEWITYFFRNTQDLLNIRKTRAQGKQCISADVNRQTKNLDMLPRIYEAIIHKRAIQFDYRDFTGEVYHLLFHPQYLQEYEGRWQLFGKTTGLSHKAIRDVYNIAIDRMEKDTYCECADEVYQPAIPGYYDKYFSNIIGVTHLENERTEHIRIRAHSAYIYGLIDTKRLHPTQQVVTPYDKYDDGEYGEFELQVEFNNELVGRILYFGDGLEVISPRYIRERFAQRIRTLMNRYVD